MNLSQRENQYKKRTKDLEDTINKFVEEGILVLANEGFLKNFIEEVKQIETNLYWENAQHVDEETIRSTIERLQEIWDGIMTIFRAEENCEIKNNLLSFEAYFSTQKEIVNEIEVLIKRVKQSIEDRLTNKINQL